ncbi:poly (ADP-ribose) polymerase family protein (macronuclear) [Tetrahymena thermophila SB210]|uniref:Poly [ADP-ribose] polymerase n=1 Tax=Tetrahymena thermophila (strain SB210) TaxID=312017 RepID=Q24C77_TETTS|nr:poly (ADP-ribose) polymerase family protein [Tetrahymena thermophila SB210]EAS05361.1 poly (ADP-ribose) polymerase family protein [Tetrahymena thermophila SB210]|eukprot:XP_001025606.1 poly (ADP-ribose) polymerase family protein [Tetrahymena thermophila SB210]
MILNNFNYPKQPEIQNQQQQHQIHKIKDSLALRVLFNTRQKEIQNLANIFRLTYSVNEYQGFIETFKFDKDKENQMEDNPSQVFIEQIEMLLQDVQKSIKQEEYECNADEYDKIKRIIKKNKAYQTILKQAAQIKFINFDNSNGDLSTNTYMPDVLKKYTIDDQIAIKVCQINKPDQLNLQFFDYFLINMSQSGLFTDSFAQNLYNSNKIFKQKIKSIKHEIEQNNSLLIDTLNFDQNEDNKQKQEIDFIFEEQSKSQKSYPLTIIIQTSLEEKNCIANLKLIWDRVLKNIQSNRKGFFQFGLSLHNSCSSKYLSCIIQFLKEKIQNQKDNFFKLPSEFWIFVSQGNENRVINMMNDLLKNKDQIFQNPKKICYNSYYSGNIAEKKYFSQETKDIIKKALQIGLEAVPFVLNGDAVTFNQNNPNLFPGVYGFGAMPIMSAPAVWRNPKSKKKPKNEDVYKDTFRIDLQKMQMQGTLQNSIFPIFEDGNGYSYFNNNTMAQKKLDSALSKMIKIYKLLDIKQISYQINLLNNQFTSTFCELNFSTDTVKVIGGQRTDNNKQAIPDFNAESADKDEDDHDMLEEDPLNEDKIDIEEEEWKNNQKDIVYQRPKIVVRGNQECINLIGCILKDIEQDKYILHEIKISSNIPKGITKLFTQLENLYKVWIYVGNQSITIQGYRKTLNNILPLIYKAVLEIPQDQKQEKEDLQIELGMPKHWEKQDDNLKLVTINLNSDEAKKVIQLFQNSMQNMPITKIERIQNISLMKNYLFEKQKLKEKGDATEKWLFHGTRATHPSVIYSSPEQGFDFRLGQGGMYGKGTYFHDDASYSHSFKYTTPQNKSQMFLAAVLVGRCIAQPPNAFVAPPFYNQAKGIRYDSVRCMGAYGHNQYIVYHNSKSYPLYLITY